MDQDPSNGIQDSSATPYGGRTSSKADKAAVKEYISSFPPGTRFVPTDEELILDYLMKKVNNEPLPPNLIRDVHLYAKDPSQLIAENEESTEAENSESIVAEEEKEWYYFTPRDKKYPKGSRPNRATPNGYWKPTGTDKAIPHGSRNPVGFKKTLDFYLGKHPGGTKTDWKMHEYRVMASCIKSQINEKPRDQMTLDDWVLCRIYKKKERRGGDDEPNDGGNQTPTVREAQNNEAAGNDNQFEDQNPNACQPAVDVSQCNNETSLTAGNSSIAVSEYQNSNASPRQSVDGASLMARNNNQFEDWNPNAWQPTFDASQYNNKASLMAGNNEIVASEYPYSNAFSWQAVNGASFMARNNNIAASEYQNSNAFQQAVNGAPLMAGNNSNASSRQAVNGASLMAGKNNIIGSAYQDSKASSSRQAVSAASSMAENYNIIGSEYQHLNASSSWQAVNEASLMDGNYIIIESEYQHLNASSSWQAVNEASSMDGNYIIIESEYRYPNASSFRQAVNGASPGNYNIVGSEYKYSNASSPWQAVNGASLMAGDNNIVFDYQNWSASQQAVSGASLMAGNNSISVSDYQYPNDSQQDVNGARDNEAYLMAGNNNPVFQDQNWNDPTASQPTVSTGTQYNEAAALMAANHEIQDRNFDASQRIVDQQRSMLHDEVPDGSHRSYLLHSQPIVRDKIKDLSPIGGDIDPSFFD